MTDPGNLGGFEQAYQDEAMETLARRAARGTDLETVLDDVRRAYKTISENPHHPMTMVEDQITGAELMAAMDDYNRCPQCGAQCVRAGGSNKHCPKCGFHEHCCEGAPQS